MRQEPQENPRQFHARVAYAVGRAGFNDAIIATHIEQTWRRGIHQEIKFHLATMQRMELENSLEIAERFWNAYHPNTHQGNMLTRIPTHQYDDRHVARQPNMRREEPRGRASYRDQQRNEYRQNQQFRPQNQGYQGNQRNQQYHQQQQPKDSAMEDLTKEFAKLRASVANLKARVDPNEEPQTYGNETTIRRSNYTNQQPRDTTKDRCYKCNEPGHYAAQCKSESRRIPNNQGYEDRRNVHLIATGEEDDEIDDYWPEVEEEYQSDVDDYNDYTTAYPAFRRNEVSPPRKAPYEPKIKAPRVQHTQAPEPRRSFNELLPPGPNKMRSWKKMNPESNQKAPKNRTSREPRITVSMRGQP